MPTDLIGSTARDYSQAYGGVPQVPSPTSTAYDVLQGNLANLGSIYDLAGGLNQFGAQQARGQYEANLPGYDQLVAQSSNDILANLKGQVPDDVIAQLQQQAAERGISTGTAGGANVGAQYLKALGLTSLGQETLGQQQLTAAVQRTPTSPLFNTSSMLVTPEQQQAAAMAANLYASAPSPQAAAAEAERKALEGIKAGAAASGAGTTIGGTLAGGAPAAGPTASQFGPAVTPTGTYVYGGLGGGTAATPVAGAGTSTAAGVGAGPGTYYFGTPQGEGLIGGATGDVSDLWGGGGAGLTNWQDYLYGTGPNYDYIDLSEGDGVGSLDTVGTWDQWLNPGGTDYIDFSEP